MSRHIWTEAECKTLSDLYPDTPTDQIAERMAISIRKIYAKVYQLGLRKSEAYLAGPYAQRISNAVRKGSEKTQFKPGHQTWNKGTHFISGGRSAETQFKPGQKPHTWNPIGHERLTKEGYLQRKVADTGVTRRDYVAVHHLIWTESGREIPKGFALIFKDGNKENITLENLELINRADLMRRNSIHNYPKEIAQLCQLRGAISRQINKREGKTA